MGPTWVTVNELLQAGIPDGVIVEQLIGYFVAYEDLPLNQAVAELAERSGSMLREGIWFR